MTTGLDLYAYHSDPEQLEGCNRVHKRTSPDGTMSWHYHSMLHRNGGPALIEPAGTDAGSRGGGKLSTWYQFDKIDRADGPAITGTLDTGDYGEWWYCKDVLLARAIPAQDIYDLFEYHGREFNDEERHLIDRARKAFPGVEWRDRWR